MMDKHTQEIAEKLTDEIRKESERLLFAGRPLPMSTATNVGFDVAPKVLTINELTASLLTAHTGKTWRVTDNCPTDEDAYKIWLGFQGWVYIASPKFADKLLKELRKIDT